MPMCVFRIHKLKTWRDIGAASAHNLRTISTPNANPNVNNLVLRGSNTSPRDVVTAAQEKTKDLTIRKNAVLAVEVLLSASPKYFREGREEQYGVYDADKLQAWRAAMEPWIAEKFPHAVSIVLHLDEATPHYQIIDIPLDEKTGRLNARGKYGGGGLLSKWQDEAAKAVEHLGIKRGLKGSKAEHTKVKQIYKAMSLADKQAPKVPARPKKPAPLTGSRPLFGAARATYDKEADRYKKARAKYERDLKAYREARKALDDHNAAVAATVGLQALENRKLKRQTGKQAYQADTLTAALDEERASRISMADMLRFISLGDVLTRLYGATKEASTGSSTSYTLKDGSTISVAAAREGGEVFYNTATESGGRGAINLILALDGCEYREAIYKLGTTFGEASVVAEHMAGQWEKTADGIAEMMDDMAKEKAAAKAREAHFLKVAKQLENTEKQPEPESREEPNQSYPSLRG